MQSTLLKRTLVALLLLPIGILIIYIGGIAYYGLVILVLVLAGWEYTRLFQVGGYHPATIIVLGSIVAFGVSRAINGFDSSPWIISLIILVCMAYELIAFERGETQAATNFGISLAGALYLGWIGSYLISLRDLPDGLWWVLLVLPSVWLADSGAYFVGKRFGRHKITPHLSPKKTWEGYLGGIVSGGLGAALLATLWTQIAGPGTVIPAAKGALVGTILGIVTILGDLGESMIKRQAGVKDSGKLLPGHGGVFDRIDSWLWAGVIGYYVIAWLFY